MSSPFIFGNIVSGKQFVNRSEEIRRLQNNFKSGNNTILISPRRWGKSSLVKVAAAGIKDSHIRFVFLNFQSLRNEESMLKAYSSEVLKATLTKSDEFIKAGKDFFKNIVPRISFGLDPVSDLSLSFDIKDIEKAKEDIFNLPEVIAKKRNLKIIVCIDEFQDISKFSDPEQLEKELRSSWMHHQHVAYCIYGSKRHMMLEIFNTEQRPFYRFGDLILLSKISGEHWQNYIRKSFKESGKTIKSTHTKSIAALAGNHSFYVQQLANEVWVNTENSVNQDIILKSLNKVLSTNEMFYQLTIDFLSNTQINLLMAIIDGEKQLTSVQTMQKYKLGTPRNVSKNKQTLEAKDIINIQSKTLSLVDPFFERWIVEKYGATN